MDFLLFPTTFQQVAVAGVILFFSIMWMIFYGPSCRGLRDVKIVRSFNSVCKKIYATLIGSKQCSKKVITITLGYCQNQAFSGEKDLLGEDLATQIERLCIEVKMIKKSYNVEIFVQTLSYITVIVADEESSSCNKKYPHTREIIVLLKVEDSEVKDERKKIFKIMNRDGVINEKFGVYAAGIVQDEN